MERPSKSIDLERERESGVDYLSSFYSTTYTALVHYDTLHNHLYKYSPFSPPYTTISTHTLFLSLCVCVCVQVQTKPTIPNPESKFQHPPHFVSISSNHTQNKLHSPAVDPRPRDLTTEDPPVGHSPHPSSSGLSVLPNQRSRRCAHGVSGCL